jgi:DNA-directed RNA polymerase subunit A"
MTDKQISRTKHLYNPEEAIGVIAAQSLSEPATQMSVSPKEKVIVKKGGIIKVLGIGMFVDSIVENLRTKVDGWDVCDISSEGVYVPSITDGENISWNLVKEVSRHNAPGKMLKLTTLSGRSITATESHSFVTRKDNRVVPVEGSSLRVGDRIPVMKYLPENCAYGLEVSEHVSGLKAEGGLLFSTRNSKPVPSRIDLDCAFGWFIGAYLSEGSCQGGQIGISNMEENFIMNVKPFAEKIGIDYKDRKRECAFGPSRTMTISSAVLSRLMTSLCGRTSGEKKVPDIAYSANESFVSGLLRGYFDGDGNVHPDRNIIRASSNSKGLIDGIALLLTRFGIFANKVKAKSQHGLLIPYKYAPLFLEKIGSDIPKKRHGLEMMASNAKRFWGRHSQDFTDMIGGFGDLFYSTAKKLGYPTRYVNNFTKRQRIGRTTLQRYAGLFESLAARRNVDIEPELSLMRTMYSSDVVWDEIARIESVKPDFEYVYDFTVPGTETFTTFDGIVTHNTMRTYHFAGTAGIQVTLGLPRIIEIFDARKELATPTMEIRLLDDYQTPEKARKVAENIKEVKLKDLLVSDVIDLTNLEIICKIDQRMLKELELGMEAIKKAIKLKKVSVETEGYELRVTSTTLDVKNLHKLKYKLLELHMKGIKGVTQAIISKENDEWVINTLGSNLKKVLRIEGVNPYRTTCNNIFEVMDVLGIEAARNAIINQSKYTLDEQGLDVDVRYIMLLADLMTFTGGIKAIGRYGIAGEKRSVLARAAFEETKKHLISASITNASDDLSGIVENIMMNQVIPAGTGSYSLIGHIPESAAKPAKVKAVKPKKSAAKKKPSVKKAAPKKVAKKKAPTKKTTKKPAKKPKSKKAAKKK